MKKHFTFTLALILSLPFSVLSVPPQTQTLKELKANRQNNQKPKLAPDLEEMLAQDDQQALTLGQIRQNRQALTSRKTMPPTRLNRLTLPSSDVSAEEKQSFIVQMDGTILGDGIILGDKTLMADGVQMAEGPATMGGSGVVFADGTLLAKGVVFADSSLLADGIILGDGTILGDGIILGDGTILGDAIRSLSIMVNGDDTPSMPVIKDDGSVID